MNFLNTYGPYIGSLSYGVVIGWLTMYYLRKVEKKTIAGFGTIISVIAGGGVLKLFEKLAETWWLYPIGLILGIIVYITVALLMGADPEVVAYGKINIRKKSVDLNS